MNLSQEVIAAIVGPFIALLIHAVRLSFRVSTLEKQRDQDKTMLDQGINKLTEAVTQLITVSGKVDTVLDISSKRLERLEDTVYHIR